MTDIAMITRMVDSLRKGIPPQQGVSLYSVRHDKFIEGVKRHHIDPIEQQGKIRFLSGSWGSGKTHLFRILREIAFQNECLVSNVELSLDEAPFNKFEMVFYSIVRNIQTPSQYNADLFTDVAPFGRVLKEALSYLATGSPSAVDKITQEGYAAARAKLMASASIDIDFKKMVDHYWKTFFSERIPESVRDEMRGEALQWFAGEGNLQTFRSKFGVNKMVSRESAKVLLHSLAGFVGLAGYRGLVILFDEAEQSYSTMKKSHLKEAQNNLLSIINNIETSNGLFMVYATTPDFFDDPKYGIDKYPALAERVRMPKDRPPSALQTIWNLDATEDNPEDYETAALKISNIYAQVYPEPELAYPSESDTRAFVREMLKKQSEYERVRFWRVMVATLIAHLDDHLEGHVRLPEVVHEDTMLMLRE